VNIVDTNLLLYAIDDTSPFHEASNAWLNDALSGADTVGLAWQVLTGFARISTNPAINAAPLSTDDALDLVDTWLGATASVVVEPTARHPTIVRDLLNAVGGRGNVVNDAHLAALAIEHRAGIVSYDTDFARFPGVAWSRPG
jgi:toxin-antitoxin system PIN domain toxin